MLHLSKSSFLLHAVHIRLKGLLDNDLKLSSLNLALVAQTLVKDIELE